MSTDDEEDDETVASMAIAIRRFKANDPGGRPFQLNSSEDELQKRPWEIAIEAKGLMPWPQFEAGAQDRVSIMATEVSSFSICEGT